MSNRPGVFETFKKMSVNVGDKMKKSALLMRRDVKTLILLVLCATAPLGLALPLPSTFPQPSQAFSTASGLPVCRYSLGGAARSTQPSGLPSKYYDLLRGQADDKLFPNGAPFYFYYNPHRYPAFMSGIQDLCQTDSVRKNVFVASGGTERSHDEMEERLQDALDKCGGEYLDLFILEYVCPYELTDGTPNEELQDAIDQANEWKQQGRVRYVGASTHSHQVGAALAENKGIDTLMLRYGMSHKDAAEKLSFPACSKNEKPVLAFTTTRWNSLQDGHMEWNEGAPTHSDCISFAITKRPPVEVVLHSAREEDELEESLKGLREDMSQEKSKKWREFGDLDWNRDGFDEYPDERLN